MYESTYGKLTLKEVKELFKKDNTLTRKQKSWIKKTKKTIKVPAINPLLILAGVQVSKRIVGQRKVSNKTKIMANKTASTITTVIIFSSIALVPVEAIGWAMIGLYALRLLARLTASISGFYGGIKKIKDDNSDNKEKIIFINEFLEKDNKEVKEI